MHSLLQSPGFVPMAAVAALSLLIALVLRSFGSGRLAVGRWPALSFAVVTVLAMPSIAWWFGLRETWPETPPLEVLPRLNDVKLHEVTPPSGRVPNETYASFLQVGDRFPPLGSCGWLNGSTESLQKLEAQVTVVDIWNELCPVCHEAAPGLKRVYEKYRDCDVQFVGLTPRSRELAEAFLKRHDISWPNAYLVDRLGQAAPQVFVLDHQGRIVWWDDRLRLMHLPERLEAELDKAIEKALSGG